MPTRITREPTERGRNVSSASIWRDVTVRTSDRLMRLAILGTRGVPASYGGFETFAEELGARLVERGHKVTVYGRSRSIPRGKTTHRGIDIVRLPAPRSKYLETVVHTIFSAAHAARRDWDAVYVCNVANVPAALACCARRADGDPQRRWPRVAARQVERARAAVLPHVRLARGHALRSSW